MVQVSVQVELELGRSRPLADLAFRLGINMQTYHEVECPCAHSVLRPNQPGHCVRNALSLAFLTIIFEFQSTNAIVNLEAKFIIAL